MNELIQWIIVLVIIVTVAVLIIRGIIKNCRRRGSDACSGCLLKDNCRSR